MDLWDELKRGAQSIVDEGSKLGRMARLKAQVRGLEAQLGDKIYDLGTRSLELHRRNELHHFELDELFAEIQAMQRELREREAEIEAAAGREAADASKGACPDCGQKSVEGDRFCRACGYRLKG